MGSARISGSVTCDELAGGPLVVSAYPERDAGGDPAATTVLPGGPGPFSIEVPAGTWWLRALLERSAPGPRSITAWSHDPVTVVEGDEVGGVSILMEAPEQVR